MSRTSPRPGDPPDPRRAARSLVKTAAVALAVIAVIAAAGVAAIRISGARRLGAAVERWRASGAPMRPSEIEFPPPRPGSDLGEWEARFRELVEPEPAPLATTPECAELGAKPVDAGEFLHQVSCALLDPRRARDLTPCERAAKRAQVLGDGERLALALELGGVGGIDWARRAREAEDAGTSMRLSDLACADAVALLADAAWESADRGAFDEALDRLAIAARAAPILGFSPRLEERCASWWAREVAMSALDRVLLLAPPGLDLTGVEPLLDEPRALESLRSAVDAERALGHSSFDDGELLRSVAEIDDVPTGFLELARDHDHASYLERFELVRGALELGFQGAVSALSDLEPPPDHARLSQRLEPRFLDVLVAAQALEAQIILTRAHVIAYRDGTEAAFAWITGRVDPFDGKPIRIRIEPDGTVVMWSVGPNGYDEGAPNGPWDRYEGPQDIVVRFHGPAPAQADSR